MFVSICNGTAEPRIALNIAEGGLVFCADDEPLLFNIVSSREA
jgi:hypothetical protein